MISFSSSSSSATAAAYSYRWFFNTNTTTTTVTECLNACLLAIASSTDNFAVGFSLGLSSSSSSSSHPSQQISNSTTTHPPIKRPSNDHHYHLTRINTIISITNGMGTFVATALGAWTLQWTTFATVVAPLLATAAFLHLAWNEYQSLPVVSTPSSTTPHQQQTPFDLPTKLLSFRSIFLTLALPLTLSNLAGGIAGGVVLGIPSWLGGTCAFGASYLMMQLGYTMARRVVVDLHTNDDDKKTVKTSSSWKKNPAYWSVAIYLLLAVISWSQLVWNVVV
jgi:putative Mn2+ efflux pump MntP